METNSDNSGSRTPPSVVEQRKWPRYPVFLDALITGERFESKACKIRDFCAGGIFVSFEDQSGAVSYASQQPIAAHDRIGIHFFTTVGDLDRSFELQARVARVLSSGLGAELIDPDPVIIAALMRAAKATAVPQKEPAKGGAVGLQDESKTERLTLLKQVRSRLLRACADWMAVYFRTAEEQFFHASRDAIDSALQREIWTAAQALHERRSKLEREIRDTLLERYDLAAKGVLRAISAESPKDTSDSELSLVESQVFEQFLAVSEVVDRAETMFKQTLFELDQRLSFVFGARIDKGNNPIGPAVLSREFCEHIRRMQLGIEPLKLALRVYQDALLPEIGDFYKEVNKFLKDNSVPLLGQAERPKPRIISQTRRRSPTAPASGHGVAPELQDVAAQLQALASSLPPGTPLTVTPVGAVQAAHTLFSLGRELATTGGAPFAPVGSASTRAFYNTAELVAALQAGEATAGESSSGLDPRLLRGRLEQALAAQMPARTPKLVSDSDWDLLELVFEIFNAVLADPRVAPEIRPYIRRLRRPMNMLALMDNAFFDQVSHPARKVLNNLARMRSLTRKGDQESVLPQLDIIVDRVANEAGSRPTVFAEADVELEAILAEQEQELADNLMQLARAAEAQQQFLRARRKEDAPETTRPSVSSSMGGEWIGWLNRARRLKVGDELQLGTGAQQRYAKVAWVADDNSSYVFADAMGRKVGSVGVQELAMQMRRGSAKVLEDLQMPAVERAMLKSLENLHGRLEKQITSDPLTSLSNEKAFADTLEQAIALARQEKVSHVMAVVAIDQTDTLKGQGDALNALLREAAARLRSALSTEVVLARLADNQFGLFSSNCSQGQGYVLLERARAALTEGAVSVAGESMSITASAGLIPFGAEALTAARVLKAAQNALAVARKAGGNTIRIHHVEEDADTTAKVTTRLSDQLAKALDAGTLQLATQRIAPQKRELQAPGLPTHLELMPSLQIERGVRVSARALRTAAEQLQRSVDLDRWLIRAAMNWVVEHPERLPTQGFCVIPLSTASLHDPSLSSFISEELITTAAPPSRFCFELTEGALAGEAAEVEELVYALREFGCRFAYSDFGGEGSSLTRVKVLQVDLVRIGRMQNRDIASDRGDAALVKSVVEMAHFVGVPAIADCINSKPVLSKVQELGIEYAQGLAVSPVELAISA